MTLVDWAKALVPLITAILAAFLALKANGFLDSRKARRDHANQLTDGLRSDVRLAVELAADYWSAKPSNKSILEAKLKMLEGEIRSSTALIDDGAVHEPARDFRTASQDFLMVLTGADFESSTVVPNPTHLRDVAGRGVALRRAVYKYRRAQLSPKEV